MSAALPFVALALDIDLAERDAGPRRPCADDCLHVIRAALRAAQRLAVEGYDLAVALVAHAAGPPREDLQESLRVDGAEHVAERVVARDPVGQLQEPAQLAEELHLGELRVPCEDRAERDCQDVFELVPLAVVAPRVPDLGEQANKAIIQTNILIFDGRFLLCHPGQIYKLSRRFRGKLKYPCGEKGQERTFKDGKREGLQTIWHDNGEKGQERTYKDGELEGVATVWNDSGQKRQEAAYRDGKLVGNFTQWHDDGQKAGEGTFKDGKKEGVETMWHENGQRAGEATYKDGELEGVATKWNDNGQKAHEGTYKDGKQEGPYNEWHENGEKKQEGTYKDGKLEGLVTHWHENGEVLLQAHYKDGKHVFKNEPDLDDPKTLEGIVGKAVMWDTLISIGSLYHLPGNPDPYTGWIKKLHDNGKVAALGALKNGKPDGLWSTWDDDGRKEEESRYIDGAKLVE